MFRRTLGSPALFAIVGACWLMLGVVVYIAYRRRQGLDLASTHKVAIPQPVVDHEAEYDSVLVPMPDGHYDETVVATAAKLAARKRRGIHVLALVTVPNALPIDAELREEAAAAESVIEQAKVQAGARVSGHVERVRPGGAGRRIVEEAVDMRAAATCRCSPSSAAWARRSRSSPSPRCTPTSRSSARAG